MREKTYNLELMQIKNTLTKTLNGHGLQTQ